jgi:GxxExxY protein
MRNIKPIPDHLNQISGAIVDSALAIHRYYGPGMLESIYEECLIIELTERGFKVESQVTLPIEYRGHHLKKGLKLDLLVEKSVIAEIKSVDQNYPSMNHNYSHTSK